MKVLIVSNLDSRTLYGPSLRPYDLGRHLAELGDMVMQVGVDCSRVEYGPARSMGRQALGAAVRAVRRAVVEFAPDVVYAQQNLPGFAAWLARWLSAPLRPLVLDFHSSPAAEYRAMLAGYGRRVGLWLRLARAWPVERWLVTRRLPMVAASSELRDLLAAWHGADPALIGVVANGARLDSLAAPVAAHNPYPGGTPWALVAAPGGRFSPNGLVWPFLVEVARCLERAGCRLRIAVVGRGDPLPTPGNVVYTGFVEDWLAYVDHADLCLLPYPEAAICGGARIKALEFLARKKLVLTTPEGRRGLEGGEHGRHFWVSSYDPERFAADVAHLLERRDELAHLGQNGYALVQENLNWPAQAARLRPILAGAVG